MVILFGIALVIPIPVSAEALKVFVRDHNENAIPGARIQIGNQERTTDESGAATFDDVSGEQSMTVSASGFSSKQIDIDAERTEAKVMLVPDQTVFTLGYLFFQIVVLLFVIGVLWRSNGWYAHTNTAASILTIVGVLGTFIGIFIGLQKFNPDPNKIQGSIEVLLNGLKIAFGTSIVGIASALLLKGLISPLVQNFQKYRNDNPRQETIDEFVDALKKAFGESNLSAKLDALKDAIKTDGKTTQDILQNTRMDITDIQSKTLKQLDTLTTTVSNEHTQLRADRESTRGVLQDTRNELTAGQAKALGQLQTLTNTLSDKNDLIIASQQNEAIETRKTLTDLQSELTDRQNKAFIQLRELTKTVSYEHSQLRKEFENFSKNVAESITELATKELISSLTKVIDQFNTQLSTQFGDNFKQLNEAVGKTVEWQSQYRQDMDKLAEEFQIAAKSIDDSRDSLENIADSSSTIADKSGSIVTSATKLEPILHTLNDQLGAFSNLSEKANGAFPIIEKGLENLTTNFSDAVQTAITDSQAQSDKLAKQYTEFQKVIDGLDDFTSKIGKVTEDVSDIVKDLQASIDSQTKALRNSANYVTTMQTKLDEQLTASINALGTDLAALSQKFVDDYTPLTNSLREVLTIANGILPQRSRN